LPAVQAAREAARRMQCSNNLKQWVLGAHNFMDVHDRLPNNGNDMFWYGFTQYGSTQRLDAVDVYGWRTLLLPFIEQMPLASELTAGLSWASSQNPYPGGDAYYGIARPWCWDYHNQDTRVHGHAMSPFGRWFASLGCPSDGKANGEFRDRTRGSNYMGCTGDYMIGEGWGENRNTRGLMRYGWGSNPMTIPPNPWGEIVLSRVTDGLSNTMYISETVVAAFSGVNADDWSIKGGVADWMTIHGRAASTCMAARGQGGEFDRVAVREPWLWEGKGHRWGDARNPYSMFHAALPPNAPSCKDSSGCVTISASSLHTSGVNVGFADGHVRFVNESVDVGDLTQRLGQSLGWNGEGHQWTGPSTVGVWGALATPSHGESRGL